MKAYQFTMTVTLEADSESAAKEEADNILHNLVNTCGHAPYSVDLDLDKDSCKEVENE